MNKLTIGLLCLAVDAALIFYALSAMRTESGYAANPAGIGALAVGSVLGFVGLMLVIKALRKRG